MKNKKSFCKMGLTAMAAAMLLCTGCQKQESTENVSKTTEAAETTATESVKAEEGTATESIKAEEGTATESIKAEEGTATESVKAEEGTAATNSESSLSEADAKKLVEDYWKKEWKEVYDISEVSICKIVPYGSESVILADFTGESYDRTIFITKTENGKTSLVKQAEGGLAMSAALRLDVAHTEDATILYGETNDRHTGKNKTKEIAPANMKITFDDGTTKEYAVNGKEVFCFVEDGVKNVTGWELQDKDKKTIMTSETDDTTKDLIKNRKLRDIK